MKEFVNGNLENKFMEKFIKNKEERIVMISNIGSASRKYCVYSINKKDKNIQELFSINFDEKEFYPKVKLKEALYAFFEIAKNKFNFSVSDIDVIAERVVAVGEYFLENRIISEEYLEKLEEAKKYDSLHTESVINEIRQIFLIKEVCENKKIKIKFKLIGISDSAFHRSIPPETYIYGVNYNKQNHFRKYGYHGISMSEVANDLKSEYKNIIGIHLGGGGSVTAIKNGKSIYNSFGMTPLSGLINLTRSGDIDPFVVLDMIKNNKKSFRFLSNENYLIEDTSKELYEKSGLFALTGERDMRDILSNLKVKDKNIKEKNEFALNVYINRINEYIGIAYSHLGEINAIALTGSILEKSEIFREKLLEKLSWLPLKKENFIIMKTEEEKEMVRLLIEEKFI